MRLIYLLIFSTSLLISCGKHSIESSSSNGIGFINQIKGEVLSEVILNENIDQLVLFLEKGGDVNSKLKSGRTLITEACFWNKYKIIETLIKYKADINEPDGENKTAKTYADENIKIKRIIFPEFVIAQKVNLITLAKENKINELKKVLEEIPPVNFFLISAELSIETDSFEGENFLTFCIKNKLEMIIRLLSNPKLELDVNLRNKIGESPLSIARKLNLKNTEKILIKLGAKDE